MITFIKIWARVLRGIPSQWEYETSHGETLNESIVMMKYHVLRYWRFSIDGWKRSFKSQKEVNRLINEMDQESYKQWKKHKKIAWL